ncbi:MAG: SseB family protein [Propionibacteriaceae bacterium]|nr:SseB family protein [Propionibacteriaceae bacterium]
MSSLFQPSQAYAGDRGEPDELVRQLLTTALDSREDYLRAVAGLCAARFLIPIVAVGEAGGSGPDPDRHAELQVALLTTADGRTGLPVFTGIDSLKAWKADARPVPCRLDEVAATAVETSAVAILVDLAGPSRLVIEGDLIAELAQGRRLVELAPGEWGWLYARADSSGSGSAG